MRYWVAAELFWISVRINRQPSPDTPAEPSSFSTSPHTSSKDRLVDSEEYGHRTGRKCVSGTHYKGGACAWGEAVGQELEAEAEMGREKSEALALDWGLRACTHRGMVLWQITCASVSWGANVNRGYRTRQIHISTFIHGTRRHSYG